MSASLLLLVAASSHGHTLEEVPSSRAQNSWIYDGANVLSDADSRRIDAEIDSLERETSAEIALVTISQCEGTASCKDFAHELFNRLGVGKEGADNGVLILFSQQDRRIEIETGYGSESRLTDGEAGAILRDEAVPRFQQGLFGAGLRETVVAVSDELRGGGAWRGGVRKVRQIPIGTAIVLGIGALLIGLMLWWLSRPPKCPVCEEEMRKLTPEQEKAYLDEDQSFEESIGSINHVVWRCDEHEEMRFTRNSKWFSGYKTCTQCRRHTSTRTRSTIRSATYTSGGLVRVVEKCQLPRCRHTHSFTVTTPRLQRSSSSSSSSSSSFGGGGGSFGGGSSGGGGAGASW